VIVDHQRTATAARAEVLLPGGNFAEGDGTMVNNEGRAQRYFQVFDPVYYDPATGIREAWQWLRDLRARMGGAQADWQHFDQVTAACAAAIPALAAIGKAAPGAEFRMKGLKVAREPHRYSGRTAMRANLSVHEPRASQDPDTALAYSMEGHHGYEAGDRPAALIPYAWAPGWNSPQSWNKFQDEVGGHLRGGDAGVRLFDPASAPPPDGYSAAAPAPFAARQGHWRVVPLHHVFGSEELSARTAVVAERSPKPYVALNPADAEAMAATAASPMKLTAGDQCQRLPLKLSPHLPRGMVGLPIGLAGLAYVEPGSMVTLVPDSTP